MAPTTGIELGPDSCVLAAARAGAGGVIEVSSLRVIEKARWPTTDVAQGEALREARRAHRFPRAAHVVAWGLPEEPPADSAISRAGLRSITAAGFRIDSVITPPQALALLAGGRPRGAGTEAVAWLALYMHGAAIAIVRGSELLFSRTFEWMYDPGDMNSRRQLLQRYSLVAHLAPELRRGIDAVRAHHGLSVDAVVTCGDLPELRSLTMPLIEELDLEVETLDSTDGLRPVGKARHERFSEAAPAIRVACAAAVAPSRRQRPAFNRFAAAAVVLLAAITLAGYAYFRRSVVRPAAPQQAAARPATPAGGAGRSTAPANTTPPAASPKTEAPQPAPAVRSAPTQQHTPAVNPQPTAPALPPPVAAAPRAVPQPMPSAPLPAPQTAAVAKPASPIVPTAPPSTPPPGATAAKPPQPEPGYPPGGPPAVAARPPTLQIAKPPRESRQAGAPPARQAPVARQIPLKDSLPKVDSILIDQNRRLAIIDGAIVAVGDAVGPRVVAQIEQNAVILREPSGLLIRVAMRPTPE